MAKSANIYNFSDYRKYLSQWLEEAKRARASNLSRLAEVAKVHPTFLSHVFAGTKHLSLEQAAFLSVHFKHTRLEREYFFTLIQLDRAGTQELREYWLERKAQLEREKNKLSERFDKHHELTNEQRSIFYSSWIYLAVWVSTAIDDGQTLAQLARRFSVETTRMEEVLTFLVQTGVCYQDGDRFRIGKVHVHIPNDSPFVVKHHSNWRMRALQKMDFRDEGELFFTAPMSISKKDFAVLREKLNVLVKEVVETARESSAEELYCMNIDFFAET